jgi:hypothetical protein
MKTGMLHGLLIMCTMLVCSLSLAAQTTAPASQPAGPNVERLTLHASAATQPSSHKLLPDVAEQGPGNAVLLYLQARRFWPDEKTTLELLYPENHRLDYQETPIDQFPSQYADRLLAGYADTLAYADLGARRRDADWDVGWRERGFGGTNPVAYLNDLRHVQNLLAFRAQYRVWQRDWGGAEYTLRSLLGIAHHLGTQPILVHVLVESGFAQIAMSRGVEQWVSREGSPNLYWALSELPSPFIEPRPVEQWESATLRYWKPPLFLALRGELPADQWPAVVREMAGTLLEHRPPYQRDPAKIEAEAKRLVESSLLRARQYLLSHGTAKEKLAGMSSEQIVGTYLCDEYRAASDNLWKFWALPYPQAQDQIMRSWHALASDKSASENPLIQALLVSWNSSANRPEPLPSILRERQELIRPDRLIALMRTIEALRDYLAKHDGRPPERLDQITDLPLPTDPMTDQLFAYHLSGMTATLDAPAPPGRSPYSGWRFDLTFAK